MPGKKALELKSAEVKFPSPKDSPPSDVISDHNAFCASDVYSSWYAFP